MSVHPEAPQSQGPASKCDVCGQPAAPADLLHFDNLRVCADCKPRYVHQLHGGVAPTRPVFRDLSNLTRWLKNLLIAYAAFAATLALAFAVELAVMLTTGQSTMMGDEFSWHDLGWVALGLVQLGLLLALGFVFLRWIYLANTNARNLGAADLRFSPGWAIGWYFIPIANLWKPYQAMKEIWQSSHDPKNWPQVKTPRFFSLWWTLWVISGILSQLSLKMGIAANQPTEHIAASSVSLAGCLVDVPLCFVAIALVTKIWDAQRRSRELVG